MNNENSLVRVYTGSVITVNLLKNELEIIGIAGIIQNDFNSGVYGGFVGGTPSAIDLFIQQSDLTKAESLISEFVSINNSL